MILIRELELDCTQDISARSIPDYAHHKFVKTTPKPSATKNRSGDEFWPPCCCGGCVGVGEPLAKVSVGDGVGAVVDITTLDMGVPPTDPDGEGKGCAPPVGAGKLALDAATCLITMRAPSARTWLRIAILSIREEYRFCGKQLRKLPWPKTEYCSVALS
jgi:hypothetical protein